MPKQTFSIKKFESFPDRKYVRLFLSKKEISKIGCKKGDYVKISVSKDQIIITKLVVPE